MISVIGFLCNFIPHVMIAVLYGSDFTGALPQWFYIFLAIAFFVYMVADNTDGK